MINRDFDLYLYRARIVRWKDADTVVVDWDLGRKIWAHDEPLRLNGLDAHKASSVEGKKATAFVNETLPPGSECFIKTIVVKDVEKQEKYGRYLAEVFTEKSVWINEILRIGGFALPWDGLGKRPTEL